MKTPSLRRRLFARLVPALVVVAILGSAGTYAIGQHSANLAYDQALMATAIDVGAGVEAQSGLLRFGLSSQSDRILRSDARDDIYYAIHRLDGRFVAGDDDLPVTPVVRLMNGASVEVPFRGVALRALSMRFEADGLPFVVTVGETLRKRRATAWSTFALMMVPTMLAVATLLGIVWVAVQGSLEPLGQLGREIERRSEIDLSPIDVTGAPGEIHALVVATNKLMRRVEASSSAYETFVADSAHQLRTPLAQILTDVDLLDAAGADASVHRRFERVRRAVERSTRLLNQLLLLARSQGDAGSSRADRVDLETLVATSADTWVHRTMDRHIDLGFDLQPVAVVGDAHLLHEMIENLMDNAIRHTPDGGTITVTVGALAGRAVVRIDDSGPGVAPADRDAVFVRFNQAGTSPGSGLGLSIVKKIAGRHGGDVSLAVSPAGGARFTVDLPMRDATPAGGDRTQPPSAADRSPLSDPSACT